MQHLDTHTRIAIKVLRSKNSEINVFDVELDEANGAAVELTIPASHNTIVMVRSGTVELEGDDGASSAVGSQQMALLNPDGDAVRMSGTAEVLVLSGEPFDEPIAHMGPFVMSTQAELRQAQRDYQSGNFGT